MAQWHVSEGLMERFLRTDVTQREAGQVVRHLLGGCPACTGLAHRLAVSSGTSDEEGAYEQVFARALAHATEAERELALGRLRGWGQWTSLEALTPQERFALVESDPRFHTWGLYDRLLEASRWYLRTEPAEAVDIVSLAILVAGRLDPAKVGKERIADLQAGAWAALGNVKRIAEDFEGSRQAFNEAWRMIEQGTGDPIEAAHVTTLEASYMKDIGEFEVAESALEEALQTYRKAQDTHRQGRTLLKIGEIIGHVEPERGIDHIRKALALVDAQREPRLNLCAQHALAQFLSDSGHPEEGLTVLERARPLYRQFHDELTQLRLHWVEGKIAHCLGDLSSAESIFGHLWDEFRARDLHQEVVLVSIELAQVLVKKGEPARAAELAAQCYSIMANWGLHRDALAAWLVFQDALAQGRAVTGLFQKVEEYYRRHWVRPVVFEDQ